MPDRPEISFSHLGIYVTDLPAMAAFYTRFFGFTITDRGQLERPDGSKVDLVFLSMDPTEHHQLVLASGRPAELAFNVINQVSFRLASLAALRDRHRRLAGEAVRDIHPVTHGNAVSVYFRDPEGNRIELFFDTPWYVEQPLAVPVDFTLDDEALMASVEAHARALPGFCPVADWRERMARKMQADRDGALDATAR